MQTTDDMHLRFNPFPTLFSERLVLREVTPADVSNMQLLRGDELAMKYIPRPRAKSAEEALQHMDNIWRSQKEGSAINWAIALQEEESCLIGMIGLVAIYREKRGAELGYMLRPSSWGKGYAREAIRLVETYSFEELKLTYLEARIDPENENSKKVLLREGYRLERAEKATLFFEGRHVDTEFYKKTPSF